MIDHDALDADLATLRDAAPTWHALPLGERIAMGERLLERFVRIADRQVAEATKQKGLTPDDERAAEEWLAGPLITHRTLRLTLQTLRAVRDDELEALLDPLLERGPRGRLVARVQPSDAWDKLIYIGFRGEVWFEEEASRAEALEGAAWAYRGEPGEPQTALVLGAGNVASIAALDVIYKLFAERSVCLLKMNPVNDYLGAFYEEAFAEFVERGFLRFAYGGAEVGAYLCAHDQIDTIHVTGSGKTHDAIVYGTGKEGGARKERDERLIDKPITSELGNVSPIIVVPGDWSRAEIDYHAQNIASQLVNNAGFNCNAARVLITAKGWPQRPALLEALKRELSSIPLRPAYYPGARERFERWQAANPERTETFGDPESGQLPWAIAMDLHPDDAENLCFREESFCSIMAETSLEANDASSFLERATEFANETLWGTLNATILIDDKSAKRERSALERALSDLRYGTIGVNHWAALAYGFGVTSWGAYPGHTPDAIGSGVGVVHNARLLSKIEKSVAYGMFRTPFVPPWFAGRRRAAKIARALAMFEAAPSIGKATRIGFELAR